MIVSVVICTRSRAASLARTLASLQAMRVPERLEWELVIVDNGSSDDTPRVVESHATTLPIRLVSEPQAGLSHARNTGIRAARGDYILWTDDDLVVDADWLSAYVAAFRSWPEAALFGGRILPVLEGTPPTWFTENLATLGHLTAARDLGDAPLPLSVAGDRLPFGASYAVRAAEQRAFTYDPDLGVGPGRRRVGEEKAVMVAILNTGHSGVWVPDAIVHHMIPARRQTTAHVVEYYEAHGETAAHLARHTPPLCVLGIPVVIWLKQQSNLLRYFLFRLLPSRIWLHRLMMYGYYSGIVQYWRLRRNRQSTTA